MAILLVLFLVMSGILVVRLFNLQIVDGQEYADNFTVKTTKTRTLKCTRGNIYDANGELLAYNVLSNCVTLEDNISYPTIKARHISLNSEIYKISKIVRSNGDAMEADFHIVLDEKGNYAFDLEEGTTALARFRADVFGQRRADDMTPEQASATPDEIMEYLTSVEKYRLYEYVRGYFYSEEDFEQYGLPWELTKQEILDIVTVRYHLSLVSYQRYVSVTVARSVSDETVAAVEENRTELNGVRITQDYTRVYTHPESMAPLIGYIGKPSAEELAQLQAVDDKYTMNSIIGKSGLEQAMETTLQGTDGSEEVTIDNLGRVLAVNENTRITASQGDDIHLTIDATLQDACYHILEQRIAGVLIANTDTVKHEGITLQSQNGDVISITDIFFALLKNNIIDINHFSSANATSAEKELLRKLERRKTEAMRWLNGQFRNTEQEVYQSMTSVEKAYINYVYNDFLTSQERIINPSLLDRTDEVYLAFAMDGTISLREYLMYAASANWIDMSKLETVAEYPTSEDVYQAIVQYVREKLPEDTGFEKLLYRYMMIDDTVSFDEIICVLYDQGFLDRAEDKQYAKYEAGDITAIQLMMEKIRRLQITPANLALDPCAGSIVMVDPTTGKVRACVTYPGYDNNRLANVMDSNYFRTLNQDLSTPFYNKATQQLTAPGSTFKPVMAAAGLTEGVIDVDDEIRCNGLFGRGLVWEGDYIACWNTSGHGNLTLVRAIQHSCNVYFVTVGWRLGGGTVEDPDGYKASREISLIRQYAGYFALDRKTNIQVPESMPHVTDDLALPSAIGQGTHEYTTTQLARYAATLANRGTSFQLTLVDAVTDSAGNILQEYTPVVEERAEFTDLVWEQIHRGMRLVVATNINFRGGYPVELYGKTGTAQESRTRPSHALFLGFAHYDPAEQEAAEGEGSAEGAGEAEAQQEEEIPEEEYVEENLGEDHMPDSGLIYETLEGPVADNGNIYDKDHVYVREKDIAFCIRIPYGYASNNTMLVGRDIMNYYYGLRKESQIITGRADDSDVLTGLFAD